MTCPGAVMTELRKTRAWNDEEKDYVRVHYKGTHASRDEIARALGRTPYGVAGMIMKLGVAKKTGRLNWRPGEFDLLRELVSKYPLREVARRMHRSQFSVRVKATRLGLSLRSREGWFTKREVCEILGVDHKRVQSYIDSGALPATYHTGNKPSQGGNASWHIAAGALSLFIRRFCSEFNGRNVDLVQIVDLLVGLEFRGARGAGEKDYCYE